MTRTWIRTVSLIVAVACLSMPAAAGAATQPIHARQETATATLSQSAQAAQEGALAAAAVLPLSGVPSRAAEQEVAASALSATDLARRPAWPVDLDSHAGERDAGETTVQPILTSAVVTPTLHVANIQLRFQPSGAWMVVWALVAIRSQNGQPVPGATVWAEWTLPNGNIVQRRGVTNAYGLAVSTVARPLTGLYELCVVNVVRPGWVYDPNQNVETCDSVDARLPSDLFVESIQSTPAPPVAGKETVITVTVANQGTGAADSFQVDWYLDPAAPPGVGESGDLSWAVPGLSASATAVLTATYVIPTAGAHSLWAQADTFNAVDESDEENNLFGPLEVEVLEPVQELCGTLSQDTTLHTGVVYLVTCDVTVAEGVTLTALPGAVVKFQNKQALHVQGTLSAIGSEADPAVFTSWRDDSHGGDTNGDGNATEPARGDWRSIVLTPSSVDNHVDHALVAYGGNVLGSYCELGWPGNLYVDGSSLTVSHSIIEESYIAGIWAVGAGSSLEVSDTIVRSNGGAWCAWVYPEHGVYYENTATGSLSVTRSVFDANVRGLGSHSAEMPVITHSTFTNNSVRAATIRFDGGGLPLAFEGNSGSNNGLNGIALQGTITSDTMLAANLNFPYAFPDNRLTVAVSTTLMLPAGTVLKFGAPYPSGYVDVQVDGTLIALGTEPEPVVFTSLKDDRYGGDTNNDGDATSPKPGDWHNVAFGVSSANNHLRYTIVAYGGNVLGTYCELGWPGSLYVDGSSLIVEHSTVEESFIAGIWVVGAGSSLEVSDTLLRNNGGHGAWCKWLYPEHGVYYSNASQGSLSVTGSVFDNNVRGLASHTAEMPVVTHNTFTDNSTRAATVRFDGGGLPLAFEGNSGSNNGINGIVLRGTITSDTMLAANPGFPYAAIDGTLFVSASTTLSFPAGLVFKFGAPYFYVDIQVDGTLVAQGTEPEPVVLTSFKDDRYGGDTNNDGDVTSPAPGDWHNVAFGLSSSNNHLEYTVVAYGGKVLGTYCELGWPGHLYVNGADLTVSHSIIEESYIAGIWVVGAGSTLVITDTVVRDNGGHGAWCAWVYPEHGVYFNPTGGSLSVTGSAFHNNVIGIYNGASSTATIQTSDIFQHSKCGVSNAGALTIDGTSIHENSCGISNGGSGTVTIQSSDVFQNSTGLSNTAGGIATIHGSNIYQNLTYGVYNANTAVILDAENNWWGDPTGPYHPILNPGGLGDNVSDYVDFVPWLEQPASR